MQISKLQDNVDEIKKHIRRLHDHNSGDYTSLMSQVAAYYKPLTYNLPQMLSYCATLKVKTVVNEWGRGTGKTTGAGGHMTNVVNYMPRSNNCLIGNTYKDILTRTLPTTITGLESHGIFQDLHYFIRREPPPKWRPTWGKAYDQPPDLSKYITFWNGAGYHLISQDVPGDGRGLNTDSHIMDEAALLSWEKLDATTNPTLRGSKKNIFEKNPFFLSTYMMSSTPLTLAGRWFIEMEEKSLRHPDEIRFISANARWNEQNLAEGWLDKMRTVALPWIYDAEYLNIRPSFTQDMFYYLLNENTHGYSQYNYNYYINTDTSFSCQGDADLDLDKPLRLGADWGSAINSLIVCQHIGREFRALKNLYVLSINRKDQNDLFDDFDKYYAYKKQFNNLIYLHYDNTGNIDTGFTKLTRAQLVKKQLEGKGWRVVLVTQGRTNPQHEKKFRLYEMVLKEDNPRMPIFRINVSNCRELLIAMQHAKAKERTDMGGIRKDKSSERATGQARVYATDLTDALDSVFFQLFGHLLSTFGTSLPSDTINH